MEAHIMKTHLATPQRSDPDELRRHIRHASHNPVIDGIMGMVGGLVAVLNQNRQILAVNHGLMEMLGVENPQEVLGLRPGEALGCTYADEMDAGCGTSPYCITCGAAIAIVSTLGTHGPVQRSCCITVERGNRKLDLFFHVHATTIQVEGNAFVLIFLNDITEQQRQAALQRSFFHDINNTIMGVLNASEILSLNSPTENRHMADQVVRLSRRLANEVALQRYFTNGGSDSFNVQSESLLVGDILKEVVFSAALHPSYRGKRLRADNGALEMVIHTDPGLLLRVLGNMIINAFEAEKTGQEIHLKVRPKRDNIVFSVWNSQPIAPSIARRIFQRNFSTKNEAGRGLGTYSMKLIGEQLLGGRVYFETSKQAGTSFFIELPIRGPSREDPLPKFR
jgi:K+-sensing histidine kinase KdpD